MQGVAGNIVCGVDAEVGEPAVVFLADSNDRVAELVSAQVG